MPHAMEIWLLCKRSSPHRRQQTAQVTNVFEGPSSLGGSQPLPTLWCSSTLDRRPNSARVLNNHSLTCCHHVAALRLASAKGHEEAVELLLEADADVLASDGAGNCPLHSAAQVRWDTPAFLGR